MRIISRVGIGSFLGLGAALLIGHMGCSSTDTGNGGFQPTGSGQGGSSQSGKSTASSSEGGTSFVGSGGGTISGPSGSGTGINPDAACAGTSSKATLVPLNMYIMFDDSGSMSSNNKWTDASTSLKAFFADAGSAGLRVALRFFPDGQCSNTACDVAACATPAVPLAALTADPAPMDAQEKALTDSVNAHGPAQGGGTPLFAALQGAENFATTYEMAHMTDKTVVVLVTDGEPNGCDNDIGHISDIAAAAFANGILTFAVGLQGSNQAQMDQIAMKGGTNQAIMISAGGMAATDLLNALQAIRGSVVSCAFTLPEKDKNGDPINPNKVNVDYTPGGMGMPVTFPQVDDAADCGNKEGWYYDDPQHPTTITLCPKTCMEVQGDKKAEIDIVFGCATHQTPH